MYNYLFMYYIALLNLSLIEVDTFSAMIIRGLNVMFVNIQLQLAWVQMQLMCYLNFMQALLPIHP